MSAIYIVTPTWNCGQEFERCVRSLIAHTDLPAKMVVVENGSLPGEREYVKDVLGELIASPVSKVEFVRYLENAENLGIPVAQNMALDWIAGAEAGPYHVVLLDGDTEVASYGWLGKLVMFAEEHPKAGIVGGSKSPMGGSHPVFLNATADWYARDDLDGQDTQGETVDFALAFIRAEVMARGLRMDDGYDFYGSHDDDMCWRVRSWGYEVWQHDADVLHHGSAAMKKAGFRWKGGGAQEWALLREANRKRMIKVWGKWLANKRDTLADERAHLERMNARLVAEAGDRKAVPAHTVRI